MSRATPQMRNFAKRLMAHEASGSQSAETKSPAAFQACDKLRPHLATLMGKAGFRVLLLRSLTLAGAEAPWLREVHVEADGSLADAEGFQAQLDPDESSEGSVVLLAQLLGLLVAFIGENLTLRLVREVWPKVPLNDLDLDNGKKNEKAA